MLVSPAAYVDAFPSRNRNVEQKIRGRWAEKTRCIRVVEVMAEAAMQDILVARPHPTDKGLKTCLEDCSGSFKSPILTFDSMGPAPPSYAKSAYDLPPDYTTTDSLASAKAADCVWSPASISNLAPPPPYQITDPLYVPLPIPFVTPKPLLDLTRLQGVRTHGGKKKKKAANTWTEEPEKKDEGTEEGGQKDENLDDDKNKDSAGAGGAGGGDDNNGGGDDDWNDWNTGKNKKKKGKNKKADEDEEEKRKKEEEEQKKRDEEELKKAEDEAGAKQIADEAAAATKINDGWGDTGGDQEWGFSTAKKNKKKKAKAEPMAAPVVTKEEPATNKFEDISLDDVPKVNLELDFGDTTTGGGLTSGSNWGGNWGTSWSFDKKEEKKDSNPWESSSADKAKDKEKDKKKSTFDFDFDLGDVGSAAAKDKSKQDDKSAEDGKDGGGDAWDFSWGGSSKKTKTKKKGVGSAALDDTPASKTEPEITPVSTEEPKDDIWTSWGSVGTKTDKKKKKKGIEVIDEPSKDPEPEPTPAPAPEPVAEAEDSWGFTTKGKKKKSPKAKEEHVPPPKDPTPEPEPEPVREETKPADDDWGGSTWGMSAKDKKKAKKAGKLGKEPEPPKEPDVVPAVVVDEEQPNDWTDVWGATKLSKKKTDLKDETEDKPSDDPWSWSTSAAEKKKAKKGKKGAAEPDPEPLKAEPKRNEFAPSEDWGEWGINGVKKDKKNNNEDVPSVDPVSPTTLGVTTEEKGSSWSFGGLFGAKKTKAIEPAVEEVTVQAADGIEEPKNEAEDDFTWGSGTKPKKKKGPEKKIAEEITDDIEPSAPVQQPDKVETESNGANDETWGWGASNTRIKKKSKKGGVLDSFPPAPTPPKGSGTPAPGDKESLTIEAAPEDPPVEDDPWGGFNTSKAKKGTKKTAKTDSKAADIMEKKDDEIITIIDESKAEAKEEKSAAAAAKDAWGTKIGKKETVREKRIREAKEKKEEEERKEKEKKDKLKKAKEEKEKKAQEEQERLEQERLAREREEEEAERIAKEEEEAKKAKEEEEAKKKAAVEEAPMWGTFGKVKRGKKAKEEAERKAKEEAEAEEKRKAEAAAELKAREEAEAAAKAKEDEEAKQKVEEDALFGFSSKTTKKGKKAKASSKAVDPTPPAPPPPPPPAPVEPENLIDITDDKPADEEGGWAGVGSFWGVSLKKTKKTGALNLDKAAKEESFFDNYLEDAGTTSKSADKDKHSPPADEILPVEKVSSKTKKLTAAEKLKAEKEAKKKEKEKAKEAEAAAAAAAAAATAAAAAAELVREPTPPPVEPPAIEVVDATPKKASKKTDKLSKTTSKSKKKDAEPEIVIPEPEIEIPQVSTPIPGGFPDEDDFVAIVDEAPKEEKPTKTSKVDKKLKKTTKSSKMSADIATPLPPPPPPVPEEPVDEPMEDVGPADPPTPPPELESKAEPARKERAKVVRDKGAASSWGFWGSPVAATPVVKKKTKDDSAASTKAKSSSGLQRSKSVKEGSSKHTDGDKSSKDSASEKAAKTPSSSSKPRASRGSSFSIFSPAPAPSRTRSTRQAATPKTQSRRPSVERDAGMLSPPPSDADAAKVSSKAAKVMGMKGAASKRISASAPKGKRAVPDPYAISDDDVMMVDADPVTPTPRNRRSKRDSKIDSAAPPPPPGEPNFMEFDGPAPNDDAAYETPMSRAPAMKRSQSTAKKSTGGGLLGMFGLSSKKQAPEPAADDRFDRRRGYDTDGVVSSSRRKRSTVPDDTDDPKRASRRESTRQTYRRRPSDTDGAATDALPGATTDADEDARRAERRAARRAEKEARAAKPIEVEDRAARRRDREREKVRAVDDDRKRAKESRDRRAREEAEADAQRQEEKRQRRREREERRAADELRDRERQETEERAKEEEKLREKEERRAARRRERERENAAAALAGADASAYERDRPKQSDRRRSHMDEDPTRRLRREDRKMRRVSEMDTERRSKHRSSRTPAATAAGIDGYFDPRNGGNSSRKAPAETPYLSTGNDKTSSWVHSVNAEPPLPPPETATVIDAPPGRDHPDGDDGEELTDPEEIRRRAKRDRRRAERNDRERERSGKEREAPRERERDRGDRDRKSERRRSTYDTIQRSSDGSHGDDRKRRSHAYAPEPVAPPAGGRRTSWFKKFGI